MATPLPSILVYVGVVGWGVVLLVQSGWWGGVPCLGRPGGAGEVLLGWVGDVERVGRRGRLLGDEEGRMLWLGRGGGGGGGHHGLDLGLLESKPLQIRL